MRMWDIYASLAAALNARRPSPYCGAASACDGYGGLAYWCMVNVYGMVL